MGEKYKDALKQHLEEMLARQVDINEQVRVLQAKALTIQQERDILSDMIFRIDGYELDKRCASCEHIRESNDEDRLNPRTYCDKRRPSVGGTFWVSAEDEGCEQWEVMR